MFGGLTLSLIPSPATNKESHCTREGVLPVLDLMLIETEAIVATAQLVQPSFTGSLAKLSKRHLSAVSAAQEQDCGGARHLRMSVLAHNGRQKDVWG